MSDETWTNCSTSVQSELTLDDLIAAVADLHARAPIPTRAEVGGRAYRLLLEWLPRSREALFGGNALPIAMDPELPPRSVRVYALVEGREVLFDTFEIEEPR